RDNIDNYWLCRFGRRSLLRAAGVGGLGLAGASLIACGGGGEKTATGIATASTATTGTPTQVATLPVTNTPAVNATSFTTPVITPAPKQGGTLVWGMESEI